jgi:UDPglucose 6-dehydrogenase
MKIKNICCIGAGYVGGPTMSVIALKCPNIKVTVVDLNEERINAWNNEDLSKLPIYEPDLDKVIAEARGRNLFFSTDVDNAIEKAEMIFIAVNTPTKTYGEGKGKAADLKYVELCARQIAKIAKTDKIIVEKSTLPVRTAAVIQTILDSTGNGVQFDVLSNPEFLAEGTAIKDLFKADRVLIGGRETDRGEKAINQLVDIYANWIPKERIIKMNLWSSELSKLVANAFLAQRVSSINAIGELCEVTEANIEDISRAIGADSRIGSKFLNTSVGFGGSCFQKDILNLVYISKSLGLNEVSEYWEQVVKMNNHQRIRFAEKILKNLFGTISGKKITLLGWAFKKDTNDTRESAAIYIADKLIEEGAIVSVYDPKVNKQQMFNDINYLNSRPEVENEKLLKYYDNPYDACKDSHAIAIITEWDEFIDYDWNMIFEKATKPVSIFDGRNIIEKEKVQSIGFNYFGTGKF